MVVFNKIWWIKLNFVPIIILVLREVFVSGLREFVSAKGLKISSSNAGKVKTFFQMVSLACLLLFNDFDSFGHKVGVLLTWVACFFSAWSAVDYANKSKPAFSEK